MNCGQVQTLLVAYLDGEVTPSERALIQAHLSNCTVCQQELTLLSTARGRVRSVLQRRAVHAIPPQEAWSRLEKRLPKVAAQPSARSEAWFSHSAPHADRISKKFFGGIKMQKRWMLSGIAGVIALAVLVVLVARNVTPVSAQQILDRAYKAQTQVAPAQGIEHIRNEIYSNIEAKEQGMDTVVESYSDPVSGNFRVVVTDKETGKVLQVYAFDGANAYTSDSMKSGQSGQDLLAVYRSPQDRPSLLGTKFASNNNQELNAALDAESKNMFDKMRQDPHVELLGQESWDNGHTVYVLRSQQEIKLFVENEITHPMGLVTFYFDVDTYQLLGNRVSMERDGKEVLISRQQILLDEILPAGSNIAWDLSDLDGINLVDDPNGEHSIAEVISPNDIPAEALAAKTDSAYLLKNVPDGFTLTISVLPKQPENEQFFYEAGYTNQAGEYFIIRTFGKPLEDTSWADETYTTASGLVLHLIVQPNTLAKGGEVTSMLMQAPGGLTFAIDSTLPRETIKALAEDLVPLK